MAQFSADKIVGKTLFAAKELNKRRLPNTSSEIVGKTSAGENVGVVFSYINAPDGVWWMFEDAAGKPYYVRHKQGNFSITRLKEQGVKTVAEEIKQKEEEEKGIGEKITDSIKNPFSGFFNGSITNKLIIGGVVIVVAYILIKKYANE